MFVFIILQLSIAAFTVNISSYIIKTDSSSFLIQYIEELRHIRPLVLFIDLDETIVAKETCISYDYPTTQHYLQVFEDHCNHFDDSFMSTFRDSLERRYYESPSVLLDRPLTAYLLSLANNHVHSNVTLIAITSNHWPANHHSSSSNNNSHVSLILSLLRSTAIRRGCKQWFHPLFHNQSMLVLPYSGAVGVQIAGVGAVFFKGSPQTGNDDPNYYDRYALMNKGDIILEINRLYLSYLFDPYSYHVALVDDTRSKLTNALSTIILSHSHSHSHSSNNYGDLSRVEPMTRTKTRRNSHSSRWHVRHSCNTNYSNNDTVGLALIRFSLAQRLADEKEQQDSGSDRFSCAAAEIREILLQLQLQQSKGQALTKNNKRRKRDRDKAITCALDLMLSD